MIDVEKFIEAFLATKTEDSYVYDATKKMVIQALAKIGKKVVDGKIIDASNLNIAKSKWNPGDKFRKKGTKSPIYILGQKDGMGCFSTKDSYSGLAGGYIPEDMLNENYELVERTNL